MLSDSEVSCINFSDLCELAGRLNKGQAMALRTSVHWNNRLVLSEQLPALSENWTHMPTFSGSCGRPSNENLKVCIKIPQSLLF